MRLPQRADCYLRQYAERPRNLASSCPCSLWYAEDELQKFLSRLASIARCAL